MREAFDIRGLSLYVNGEHRFGSDALELARFAGERVRRGYIMCDLCTGCGIIPFAIMSRGVGSPKPTKIYALDINAQAVAMLCDSVEANGLGDVIAPVCEDLNFTALTAGMCDMVTVNPPYFKADDGFKREKTAAARHEILCTLDDVAKASSRLIKYGGRLVMCHLPERAADVITALRRYNLEVKTIEFINNEGCCEPWLMLTDAKKGGKPGMKVKVKICSRLTGL